MHRPASVWYLTVVLIVLAFGGLAGAYGFLSDPSGVGMGMAGSARPAASPRLHPSRHLPVCGHVPLPSLLGLRIARAPGMANGCRTRGLGQGTLGVGGIASPGDRLGPLVDHPGVLHRVLVANPVVHGLLGCEHFGQHPRGSNAQTLPQAIDLPPDRDCRCPTLADVDPAGGREGDDCMPARLGSNEGSKPRTAGQRSLRPLARLLFIERNCHGAETVRL